MPAVDDTLTPRKAGYLYNFTKYIDWPASAKQGNFIIGVLGTTPIYGKVLENTKDKKVNNQTIEVKNFATAAQITSCQLLFVPSNFDNLSEIVSKLKKSSTLIVTDKVGMVNKGSIINFIWKDNKLQYEVNKANAEKNDLKVGAQLINTAAAVIEWKT